MQSLASVREVVTEMRQAVGGFAWFGWLASWLAAAAAAAAAASKRVASTLSLQGSKQHQERD